MSLKSLDNPVTRMMFKKYIIDEKLDGIFLGMDTNGKITVTECERNPITECETLKAELAKLKKLIYG